ncbi:MAG: DUF4430 domain-containing protein [Patescibacteria group bacterium]|nr:DUF4430 domain-containing protein [Patescibacteria group bacterium]MDD4304827.1 DUF4430 domain-containing protein [Patescibacteria group bacterium]MDD4695811.1 DUF4430 domain-containing protein [Patescibacteria group bacterium]
MNKISIKKNLLSVLIIFMLVFSNYSFADNSNTITFLQNQTQNTWITQALVSANAGNINISYIDLSDTSLLGSSKNLLALSSVESTDNNTLNTLANNILSTMNNGQLGESSWLNDDFWGVLALSSVSKIENGDLIKSFILNNQNDDGGWSWAVSGYSDTNDTAAAIMALLELGVSNNNSVITNALNYLENAQNDDGGFGYDTNSNSDSNSTSWVISTLNKLNIDSNTWNKDNNTPLTFLESLRQNDGSYLWASGSTSGINLSTAYALIAISGASYPVKRINIDDNGGTNQKLVNLRIESPDNTICLAKNIQANNVLELLQIASNICDYDFIIEDTAYGSYVSSIDNLDASGMNGWQYFVNWAPAMVSAQDYILNDGDEVLWAYGSALGIKPTQIEVNSTDLNIGDNLKIIASYFEDGTRQNLPWQDVYVGDTLHQTNQDGEININILDNSPLTVYVKYTDTYIRSNKLYINSSGADSVSHSVNLSANVLGNGGGSEYNDEIAFSIDKSNIDFENLAPNQSKEETLTITNIGNVGIHVESNILGDDLFNNTRINNTLWEDFNINLDRSRANELNIRLTVPGNYEGTGTKNAELIFWAVAK